MSHKKNKRSLVHEFEQGAYRSDWFARAACSGMETSLFFPASPRQHTDFEYFETHITCMDCEVVTECVASAVIRNDDQGFMGIPGINRQKMDLNSDVKKSIARAFIEFSNLEPQFSRTGKLLSRRCVSCYRRFSKIPVNANDWGGRQSKCADCLMNNKKSGIKQSTASPIYDEWGLLITKICSKCMTRKGADQYSKRAKGIGGLKSWCKSCMVTYEKGWRKNKQRTKNLKSVEEIVAEQHERK